MFMCIKLTVLLRKDRRHKYEKNRENFHEYSPIKKMENLGNIVAASPMNFNNVAGCIERRL